MNTDYGIRPVTGKELVEAFGSAERALEATGGDELVALLYLNNTDRIANAPPSGVTRESQLTIELRKLRDSAREYVKRAESAAAAREREAVENALAQRARQALDGMEKPSVAAVARVLGVHWHRAKALLERKVALP